VQEARGPIPAPRQHPVSGGRTTVYDVEAEGGLLPGVQEEHHEDPLDLMTAMRKRSTARGRRKSGGRSGPALAAPSAARVDTVEDDDPAQATLRSQVEQPHLESPADSGFASVRTHQIPAQDGPVTEERAPQEAAAEPVETPVREARSKPQPKKRQVRDAARKTGRPSVPAWDEIMFGSKSGVDRSSS